MQCLERRLPLVAIDEVVPVRNQIIDRAPLVAERDAAVHAAGRLLAGIGLGQRLDEFLPAAAPDLGLLIGPVAALYFKKAGRLSHWTDPAVRTAGHCPSPRPSPRKRGEGGTRVAGG